MAQFFTRLPSAHSSQILCYYVNATSKIQIARITNIPNWYFERIVFPGERLFFNTVSNAQLEIHTSWRSSAILADTIPCESLRVNEGSSFSLNNYR
ncbi:MAG TPA: DUF1830 domain-containing protein [Coleofasciculaceae cyanobacterium]